MTITDEMRIRTFDMGEDRMNYDDIVDIVGKAGNIIRSAHENEMVVFNKQGDANFVTKYDKEVQSFLIKSLRALFPDANFLAEEDGIQQELGEGYCFIIDPIDGTTNFISDYRYSCISVGLAVNGKMEFGVVYNPYLDEMYTAVKGEGAQKNGSEIHVREAGLEGSLASFGAARYNTEDADKVFEFAKMLYLNSQAIRTGGSAALDLCRVADGSTGVYFEMKLQPWDYAAASLILAEAGGFISTMEGQLITLDQPCSILAGNRQCWKETFKLFRDK